MKNSIVQIIAHKLFLERTGSLEYELTEKEFTLLSEEESGDYYLKGNKLIFSSYESRDKYIVTYYCSTIDFNDPDVKEKILKLSFDIYSIGLRGGTSTAGLFLSQYEDKIDILDMLATSTRNHYETTSLTDQFLSHT
ncbi:TPA: hypothetical protein R4S08_004409, partial [Kluyvera ascorbata]|nr:hypothetical protein [Kluyvera ascorbata]